MVYTLDAASVAAGSLAIAKLADEAIFVIQHNSCPAN
jgi:hypothetical protein